MMQPFWKLALLSMLMAIAVSGQYGTFVPTQPAGGPCERPFTTWQVRS
jgi:hypothetical protein